MSHLYALADKKAVNVQVVGKADFQDSEKMQKYCLSALDETEKLSIDLEKCSSMDSTFMGMITKICFSAIKLSIPIEVNHANYHCKGLLTQLGVSRLFKFTDNNIDFDGKIEVEEIVMSMRNLRKNVIETHEKLIEADKMNESKFRDIIDILKKGGY